MEENKPIEETNLEEKAEAISVEPQKPVATVRRTVTKKPVAKKEAAPTAAATPPIKSRAVAPKPAVEIISADENQAETVAIENMVVKEEPEFIIKNDKIKKHKKMSTKLTEKEKKEKAKKKEKLAVAKSKQKLKEKKAKKKKKEKAKKEKAKKKLKEKASKKKAAAKKKKAKAKSKKK
jgi:hypothetical protein